MYKAALFAVIALMAGLLFVRLSEPFDGFHGFQEAWYAAIAENYSSHSFFLPTTYHELLDLNVPPLFSYLLYLSFSLFGPSEAAARIVPVVFSLFSLVGLYLLAERLVRRRSGLEAAALLASTPIFLILGRNVQTDIVFVALSLFFIYFYLRARENGSSLLFVIAGLFLGLALLTKQFAVIPAAAIIVWELLALQKSKIFNKKFLLLVMIALLVLAPYYGYHLMHDPARLLSAQLQGSASKAGLATGPTFVFLLGELLWACSPLVLIGALTALVLSIPSFDRSKLLITLMMLFFFLFYLFFHRHSYYAFGMVPFLALAFVWLGAKMNQKTYRVILLISVATGCLLSAYQSAGSSYGGGELKQVGEFLKSYRNPVVLADDSFILNYEPLFSYYAPNAILVNQRLQSAQREQIRCSDGMFTFSDIPFDASPGRSVPVMRQQIGIKLGNRCFVHNPPNMHFFTPGLPEQVADYRLIKSFGPFVLLELPHFFLVQQSRRDFS